MKKSILTFCLFAGIFAQALAGGDPKTTSVRGDVTDRNGEPLAGVKIYLPTLDQSVYTDFEGQFELGSVPLQGQTLKLTYISFEEEEFKLELSDLKASYLHLELRSK